MATAIFAPTASAASGTVTVTDAPVEVFLNAPGGLYKVGRVGVTIELQNSDGGYTFIEMMDAAKSGLFLSGKGVWRLSKPETNYAYGADRSDP